MMLLPAVPDEWEVEAFTKGLNLRSLDASRKLKESLIEFQATTWADVHDRYKSKIRIEEDQLEFPISAKGTEARTRISLKVILIHIDDLLKAASFHMREAKDATPKGSGPRICSFPTEKLIVARKKDHCKKKRTGDCQHLREEVAMLLKNDHLREFLSERAKNNYGHVWDNAEPSNITEDPPRLTINKIFGGNEINGVTFSVTKKTKVSVTHNKRLREVAEDDITFTEEDADGLLLPHNDALVISLNVLDFNIKRVLVDPESSTNVIQWRVLEQAKLIESMILAIKLIAGFNLASMTTEGRSYYPLTSKGSPRPPYLKWWMATWAIT
ncbi:uncharacterized protein LOC142169067 [Nicotiana tabacum]|uniref:Uncharacterized protein LOC142169067 n=1 Tax=Nicotiana tabacum TaxID=4097 RepID=A0AC58SN08_TOBAC